MNLGVQDAVEQVKAACEERWWHEQLLPRNVADVDIEHAEQHGEVADDEHGNPDDDPCAKNHQKDKDGEHDQEPDEPLNGVLLLGLDKRASLA